MVGVVRGLIGNPREVVIKIGEIVFNSGVGLFSLMSCCLNWSRTFLFDWPWSLSGDTF